MIGGPCIRFDTTTPTATVILGLDLSFVDVSVPISGSGFRAVLLVDATVKFHAVRITNGDVTNAADVLGDVTWSISDNTAATLTPQSDGSAQLLAIRPGRVGTITANGSSALYACSAAVPRICYAVAAIDVVAVESVR